MALNSVNFAQEDVLTVMKATVMLARNHLSFIVMNALRNAQLVSTKKQTFALHVAKIALNAQLTVALRVIKITFFTKEFVYRRAPTDIIV